MSIINTQAVANAKKVLTGKNGALYNAKGKLLATMETYQAQVNVTNTKFQPLGDPQEHEIFTSYGQTLTFTEIVVEDGEFITDLLAGMKSGEMPSWVLLRAATVLRKDWYTTIVYRPETLTCRT